MGLYACKECGKGVSDKALECQHCGCPTASKVVWQSLSELNTPITFIFLSIGLMVTFLLINPEYFFVEKVSERSGKLADLGDFLGGLLNPLLTFISVILLISTLKLTRDSVDISKRELMLSRQAMAESAVALKNQAQSLEIQNFNSLFFSLLSYLEARTDSLKIEFSNGVDKLTQAKGKECFVDLVEEIKHDFGLAASGDIDFFDINDVAFNDTFADFRAKNHVDIDNYMLTIRTILRAVDRGELHIKKDEYIGILKSQLSTEEFIMIMYFATFVVSDKGPSFRRLLKKFDFFKNIKVVEGTFESKVKALYSNVL